MAAEHRPYGKNAAGAFYVVEGCCTLCGVPETVAPALFDADREQCFVRRQPATSRELGRMLLTVLTAEFACIRYRGDDAEILRRLAEMGEGQVCDVPPPVGVVPVTRRIVSFVRLELASALELLAALTAWLTREGTRFRARALTGDAQEAVMEFAWYEEEYHRVRCTRIDRADAQWVLRIDSMGAALTVHDWLEISPGVTQMCWYSEAEWAAGRGRPHPV